MSVVIETTLGDVTVDLFIDERPQTCLNFLKLCKIKYYNLCLFHSVSSNFLAQTGDPTGKGDGGESVFGIIRGKHHRLYQGEKLPRIKHDRTGLLSMVSHGDGMLGSQFIITLSGNLTSLDQEHCVFGHIVEGFELLLKLNEAITDDENRPYQDISRVLGGEGGRGIMCSCLYSSIDCLNLRITHTVILDDPFPDPEGLECPPQSPVPPNLKDIAYSRIPADEPLTEKYSPEELDEMVQQREAAARAAILEMVGDIPDADIAPPENVLFVCKLNPVTSDHDLSIIFSRFGTVKSCEVIRDQVTGDSLQYAFVEFEDRKACEDAYFKMDNVLIDDRRIHVDFSQSVAKLKWKGKGKGVEYLGPAPPGGWGNRNREQRPRAENNKNFENKRRHKMNDRGEREMNSVRNGKDLTGGNHYGNMKKIKAEEKREVKRKVKPRRRKSSSSSSSSSVTESSDSSSESSESFDEKRKKRKSSRKVLVVVKTPRRSRSRKKFKKSKGKYKRHKEETESESDDSDVPKKKKKKTRRRSTSSDSSTDEAEKRKKRRKTTPSSEDEPKSKKRKKKDHDSSDSSSDDDYETIRKRNKNRKRKGSSCSSSDLDRNKAKKRRKEKFKNKKKKKLQNKKLRKRNRYDSGNSSSS